ncbi:hypothetical protein MPTK1_4g06700 [Marchantia polymorpha subsp. ruderalis]|uniref:Uncharacterized protein n=2 Tax=Marchantia polymorpha TaxID=3197 RepID=A0AAF6B747_MARPO|nr:hypothetical protein MARPO_0125s0015 [Marchantia polymorpha]BBN07831.1 hypothetical protein Mp_4g06700 [Marchantia polymorpha subsp. ruderalis]|eukprot:PTQ30365.1 hypothetical protein MARPO_0125s0015 [Marchantia polymorpha]
MVKPWGIRFSRTGRNGTIYGSMHACCSLFKFAFFSYTFERVGPAEQRFMKHSQTHRFHRSKHVMNLFLMEVDVCRCACTPDFSTNDSCTSSEGMFGVSDSSRSHRFNRAPCRMINE